MKSHSAKAKGRKLQKNLAERLVSLFPAQIGPDDITSRSSGANGEDILISPKARAIYPFKFECKNIKSFVGYNYLDQAKAHKGNFIPVAVVKANRKEPLVVMELEDFLSIFMGEI